MLDPRVYRAALLPVLLALIVVAFSLENRPGPLRTTLTADAFDAVRAERLLDRLVAAYPERPAGGAADTRLASRVAAELRAALPGVRVQRRVISAATPDGDRELVTVLAQQPGSAPRSQLVVVAARDASGRGAAAQLSGTAALIELARVIAATRPSRSVTFASVSGETGGQGGMRDLVEVLDRPVDALLELGDMAGPVSDRLLVVPWSDASGMAPMRLQRTVALALRQEAEREAGTPRARTELARFAWPWSASGQGVANVAGLAAVRLSASGESAPAAAAPVSVERMGDFGRSALRAVLALEEGPRVGATPVRDLAVARKMLPAWAMRLLVLALLLPPLITIVDAVARSRRRREPLRPWLGRILVLAIAVRAGDAVRARPGPDGRGARHRPAAPAGRRSARRRRLGGDRLHPRGGRPHLAARAAADGRPRRRRRPRAGAGRAARAAGGPPVRGRRRLGRQPLRRARCW